MSLETHTYRSTKAIINTKALRKNIRTMRELCPKSAMMAMVKANAYGHGIIECSRIAVEEGIDFLGVAFASEAIQLRQAGIQSPIVLMTPPEASAFEAIIDYSIETILCDNESLQALSSMATAKGKVVSVHVYIDTGMHRDGIMPEEVIGFVQEVQKAEGLNWKGICTHMATADSKDTTFMNMQQTLFEDCLSALRNAGFILPLVHSCNSAASIRNPSYSQSLIRLGLSIYGYSPVDDIAPALEPVLSLVTGIVANRRIKKGESVSYGRSFITSKDTNIATIPIG